MPISIVGRRSTDVESRKAHTRWTSSIASSGVLPILLRLCSREAEIGMVNLRAPAAIASSAPLRLGTSTSTLRFSSLFASLTRVALSAI